MFIKPIRLTLLNHLFYYTEISGGTASATITGGFLGDLALCYAFRNVLHEHEDAYLYRDAPAYEEIQDFGFYCTIARPSGQVKRTESYIQNTLFNVDGFHDLKSIEKSGKSPFKNFRQVQGIAEGTSFEALLLAKDKLQLPPTIRVGRAKETLVKVEALTKAESDYWLNAFSLKVVYNNLQQATDVLMREQKVNFSYLLENYGIIKNFTATEVAEIFKPVFDA